jgi:hypothetical protein
MKYEFMGLRSRHFKSDGAARRSRNRTREAYGVRALCAAFDSGDDDGFGRDASPKNDSGAERTHSKRFATHRLRPGPRKSFAGCEQSGLLQCRDDGWWMMV